MSARCVIAFFTLFNLFIFSSNAYVIVSEKTEVTPGYEGGVFYSVTESKFVSSMSEFIALVPEGAEVFIIEEEDLTTPSDKKDLISQ